MASVCHCHFVFHLMSHDVGVKRNTNIILMTDWGIN